MYWVNFLHVYQLPTQTEAIVLKVTKECYRTLVRVLEEATHVKITLNINAVLTRHLLDEGLHSCQYWWASCRPWWDTSMIEWGAKKLLDAVSEVKGALPRDKFQQTSALFNSIVETARKWQEFGEAKRRKEEYLREHREVSSELTFGKGTT